MIGSPWLLVLLTVLAVARLTRLVTADVLTQPIRGWVIRRRITGHPERDETDPIIYLLHCRWCASMWIALPAAAAVYAWHEYAVVQVLLIALSASHVTALLAGLEDD